MNLKELRRKVFYDACGDAEMPCAVCQAVERGIEAGIKEVTESDNFVICTLCGLPFHRKFSGDISQCYRCHWLLNRLALIPIEQAQEAWEHYKKAIDAVRGKDEAPPAHWYLKLFTNAFLNKL